MSWDSFLNYAHINMLFRAGIPESDANEVWCKNYALWVFLWIRFIFRKSSVFIFFKNNSYLESNVNTVEIIVNMGLKTIKGNKSKGCLSKTTFNAGTNLMTMWGSEIGIE